MKHETDRLLWPSDHDNSFESHDLLTSAQLIFLCFRKPNLWWAKKRQAKWEMKAVVEAAARTEGWGEADANDGGRYQPEVCSELGPLPRCDQRGGSSLPDGARPFSMQERKARRWPPAGKCNGGRWTPSWPTRTTIPPLAGPERRKLMLNTLRTIQLRENITALKVNFHKNRNRFSDT